jgi:hypothetical protein
MKRLFVVVSLLLGYSSGGTAASSSSIEEQSAWLAASASDVPDAYSEFVKKFPDGTFAPLARIRLNEAGAADRVGPSMSSAVDLVPLDKRYTQRRSIEPRPTSSCLSNPDAGCVLSEITGLIAKQDDATRRLRELSELAQRLAPAGDIAGGLKYLQQAASLARGLAGQDQVDYLGQLAESAFLIGAAPVANDLLNEALSDAKMVAAGKSDSESLQDRGRALVAVGSHFANIGKADDAKRVFAEAQSLTPQMQTVYRASMLNEIAEAQANGGLLQNAILTITDLLNLANDMPQFSSLGLIVNERYDSMGRAAELLASVGQDAAAASLARSIGPLSLRTKTLLRVRDKLNDKGARDLASLETEIRDTAREAAKTKDAWIYASGIGCALARFASVKEGVSVAGNLFAQSKSDMLYYSQAGFVECLANIGPDQAAEYLMTTRLPSDPKAASEFKDAIGQILRSYARRGNLKAAKEWNNKLPEADRSSAYDDALYYFEERKREQIKKLCLAGQLKEAIAEARQLQSVRDRELYGIVIAAVNAKDLNSALEAARLIGEDTYKVSAYKSLLELI